MDQPWLITRPLDEALADVAALASRGVAARAFPVLERRPLPWDRDLDVGLVLLSAASVLDALREAWPNTEKRPRIAALGPATAAKARSLGLPVDLEVTGGAGALAEAVLNNWDALNCPLNALYPTSDLGLASSDQRQAVAVLASRMAVRRVAVVSVRAPADLADRVAALDGPGRWVFASPSAVSVLLDNCTPERATAALCHGRSTVDAYRRLAPAGWPEPLTPPGATVIDRVVYNSYQD